MSISPLSLEGGGIFVALSLSQNFIFWVVLYGGSWVPNIVKFFNFMLLFIYRFVQFYILLIILVSFFHMPLFQISFLQKNSN